MGNRILALGVIESMTYMTGHAPRPAKSHTLAWLAGYAVCLAIGGGMLAMVAR